MLTNKEKEILHLLSKGLTNQEIADQLLNSSSTIKNHLRSIFMKLKVSNRTQAVMFYFQHGAPNFINSSTNHVRTE